MPLDPARGSLPPPRLFQVATHAAARVAIAAGMRRILIYSPTGSGKTILAMFLIHEALLRDKRVIFVARPPNPDPVADSLGQICRHYPRAKRQKTATASATRSVLCDIYWQRTIKLCVSSGQPAGQSI